MGQTNNHSFALAIGGVKVSKINGDDNIDELISSESADTHSQSTFIAA